MEAVNYKTAAAHSHGARNAGALPLSMAGRGVKMQVCSLRGGEEQKRHLASLGFAPGAEVSVVSDLAGDIIVDVKGARIALGKQMAQKIMVA